MKIRLKVIKLHVNKQNKEEFGVERLFLLCFQIELKFRVFVLGENWRTQRKTHGARMSSNNELNSLFTIHAEILSRSLANLAERHTNL